MIKIDFDMRGFGRQVRALAFAYKKDIEIELKKQTRLIVKDCISHTPPFGNAPGSESFAAQRKIGEAAVTSQIHRVFSSAETNGDGTLSKEISQAARRGDVQLVKHLYDKAKFRYLSIMSIPVREVHRSMRNNRGQVPKRGKDRHIVMRDSDIRKYIKDRQKNVGMAKAGWLLAARNLGAKSFPPWISRHSMPGAFRVDRTGNNVSFFFGNRVGYIQGFGREERIVEKAIHSRQVKMVRELGIASGRIARSSNKTRNRIR